MPRAQEADECVREYRRKLRSAGRGAAEAEAEAEAEAVAETGKQKSQYKNKSDSSPYRVFWPVALDEEIKARNTGRPCLLLGWTAEGTVAVVSALATARSELSNRLIERVNARLPPPGTVTAELEGQLTRVKVVGAVVAEGDDDDCKNKLLRNLPVVVRRSFEGERLLHKFSTHVQLIKYETPRLFHSSYPQQSEERERGGGVVTLSRCLSLLNGSFPYRIFAKEPEEVCDQECLQLATAQMHETCCSFENNFRISSSYFHSYLWTTIRSKLARRPARRRTPSGGDILSPIHECWTENANIKLAAVADHIFGVLIAVWIWQNHAAISKSVATFLTYIREDVVIRSVTMLQGAPGGLKLYDDLSHFFGWTSKLILGASVHTLLSERVVTCCACVLTFVSGLLGLGIGASLLADVMLLLAIPYITLYYIYSFVLRCHLKLSREMYLLFRGKWQDDSSENFVLEHVIVGVLLLTPLLFLLPTVLVYYALWLILFVTMKVGLLGIQAMVLVARFFPYASIWFRFWRPEVFRAGIYLDYEDGFTVRSSYKPYLELTFGVFSKLAEILFQELLRDMEKVVKGRTLVLSNITNTPKML